ITFNIPPARVVQIDIDPQEIDKIYPVAVGIVGDAKATLRELIVQLNDRPPSTREAAAGRVAQRKRDWAKEVADTQTDEGKPIHPARLLKQLSEAAPLDAIFVTDVGWNKNGAGQQILSRTPRSFITSGGLATMGFSPAAAIGAKLAAPNRPVMEEHTSELQSRFELVCRLLLEKKQLNSPVLLPGSNANYHMTVR